MGDIQTQTDSFDLTGRVTLITGASLHGIGNSSAKLLAEHGANAFLTVRREEKLEQAVRDIESAGVTAAYRAADVSHEEECAAAVQACLDTFGRLDIMVLSAGTSGLSASVGYDAVFDSENWRIVQSINLDGVFFMVKYAARECAKHGCGSIIPVGSLASWHYSGSAAYTATKGALRSLVQYFGHMLAPDVRVNGIYPGLTDTDMTHPATEHPQFGKMLLSNIPIGRFGTPEDIANGVLYLASDASLFMAGQHLVVDGGELA